MKDVLPEGRKRLASVSEPRNTDPDALGVFKAKYFGSVCVDQPQGFDVVLSATLKVKNSGQEARKVGVPDVVAAV